MFTICFSKQHRSTRVCGESKMITKRMPMDAQNAQLFGKRWKRTKKAMSPSLRQSSRNTYKSKVCKVHKVESRCKCTRFMDFITLCALGATIDFFVT